MTDKLPEWLDSWIADNEIELRVRDKYGDCSDIVVAVDSDDLRTFLSRFVLCDKTPHPIMSELAEALRSALEDICGAKLCLINSMSSRDEVRRLMQAAADTLRKAEAALSQCGGKL